MSIYTESPRDYGRIDVAGVSGTTLYWLAREEHSLPGHLYLIIAAGADPRPGNAAGDLFSPWKENLWSEWRRGASDMAMSQLRLSGCPWGGEGPFCFVLCHTLEWSQKLGRQRKCQGGRRSSWGEAFVFPGTAVTRSKDDVVYTGDAASSCARGWKPIVKLLVMPEKMVRLAPGLPPTSGGSWLMVTSYPSVYGSHVYV